MQALFMKRWKICVVIIFAVPVLLMFLLHICIAFENYFTITLNIEDIHAKDWFLFYANYLAGVITMIGVMYTIFYSTKAQYYNTNIKEIEDEQIRLSDLINSLDVLLPTLLMQQFYTLERNEKGFEQNGLRNIRNIIAKGLADILKAKREIMLLTDIYTEDLVCKQCKEQCSLPSVKIELKNLYEKIANDIFFSLQDMDEYINDESKNMLYSCFAKNFREKAKLEMMPENKQEYERLAIENEAKIVDTKNKLDALNTRLAKIIGYNNKEMWELINLSRQYINLKKKIIYKSISDKK